MKPVYPKKIKIKAQTNEIFSFRGEKPPLSHIIAQGRPIEPKEFPDSDLRLNFPSSNISAPNSNLVEENINNNNEIKINENQNDNNNENNNNNNPNVEENEEDEDENEEDLEVISVLMTKILKTHFNFQIFFLFILSYLQWELPLYIIFSISWLNDLLNLIFYTQKLKNMKRLLKIKNCFF